MDTPQRYEHIVALSYYHPWFGGGAHRPRQLMLADAAAGASIDFVFCSPTDLHQVRQNDDSTGHTMAYLLSAGGTKAVRIGPTEADDVEVDVEDLLPIDRGSGYVRAHNPAEDLLPVIHAARRRSVLTVYDQMNYWAGCARQPWGGLEIEAEYLVSCDAVVAVTEQLAAKVRHPAVHVVPDGVNDRMLERLAGTAFAGRRSFPPTVLYSGAMWPDWFDWPLVFETVAGLPQVNFVFLGALSATQDEDDGRPVRDFGDKLADLPNVRIIDELPHEQIAEYLAEADLGLVPFVVNDVTNPRSPLKVFEYLAAGMPVVSTPLESLVGFPGVTLCAGAEQWRHAILSALQEGHKPEAVVERLVFARQAAWSARAVAFQKVIDEYR